MSQKEKLLAAFRACNGPFPASDLTSLLRHLGYREVKLGHTAGSARKYFNPSTGHIIRFHAPHGPEVKSYVVRDVRAALEERDLI
jgi:hypothetical protein